MAVEVYRRVKEYIPAIRQAYNLLRATFIDQAEDENQPTLTDEREV